MVFPLACHVPVLSLYHWVGFACGPSCSSTITSSPGGFCLCLSCSSTTTISVGEFCLWPAMFQCCHCISGWAVPVACNIPALSLYQVLTVTCHGPVLSITISTSGFCLWLAMFQYCHYVNRWVCRWPAII
jgi:hypothetical protein